MVTKMISEIEEIADDKFNLNGYFAVNIRISTCHMEMLT